MPDYRPDLLGAYISGVASMALLGYIFWLKSGTPPAQ